MICCMRRLMVFSVTVLPLTCAGQDWTFYLPSGSMQIRSAPNQTASQNRYKISGTVNNSVTGEPIGRALVHINGTVSQQAFTDGSGRFEISDVPEGQIAVSAQRPGFVDSQFNGHRPQMITIGPATPSIQIKLIPEGFIKGKVADEDGEPLEGVGIELLFQQINEGRKSWLPRGGTQTDENGEYQVESLPPGQYLVHTVKRPRFLMSVAAGSVPLNEIYPLQYFPSAPSQESAQSLTVQPGQTAEADFRLSPAPSYSISGTVLGPQANSLSCEDEEGNLINFGRVNNRNNHFNLARIPTGSCTVTAHAQSPDGHTYYAEQPVTVNSSNVTNVQLALEPLPEIPLHFSNSNSNGGMPVQLQLVPRHKHWQNGPFYPFMQGNSPEAQTPVFRSVPPGTYQVVFHSFNNNTCVSAMTSGSTDLLRADLTVVAGAAQATPIEVTMSNDCAAVTVSTVSSPPGQNIFYFLMPDPAGMQPRIVNSPNTNLVIGGLTPGDYTVYAFTDISDLEYSNPEAMREFSGQKVTLGPGEKATMQLNLVTRGGSQ